MIGTGTQIINIITNTTHTVDDVEVINGETLVFTTDMNCFPIEDVEKLHYGVPNTESKKIISDKNDDITLLQSIHLIIDISEFPSIPYQKKKSFNSLIKKIFSNIW